jgi:hypothetical protein
MRKRVVDRCELRVRARRRPAVLDHRRAPQPAPDAALGTALEQQLAARVLDQQQLGDAVRPLARRAR